MATPQRPQPPQLDQHQRHQRSDENQRQGDNKTLKGSTHAETVVVGRGPLFRFRFCFVTHVSGFLSSVLCSVSPLTRSVSARNAPADFLILFGHAAVLFKYNVFSLVYLFILLANPLLQGPAPGHDGKQAWTPSLIVLGENCAVS